MGGIVAAGAYLCWVFQVLQEGTVAEAVRRRGKEGNRGKKWPEMIGSLVG